MGPFHIGTAIALGYDENGYLGVQTDGHGNKPGVPGRGCVGSFGLIGRPLPANSNGDGALCLFADEGAEGFAWVGFDGRDLAKIPPLSSGSTGLVASDGAFLLQDYAAETTTLYRPMVTGTKAHIVTIGKDSNGKQLIDLLHANGSYFTLAETETTWRHTGNGFISIKGDEITLNGTVNTAASFTVGGAMAQPVVNATTFGALLATLAASLNAAIPITPYEIALQAALLALVGAYAAVCPTQMLKGI